MKNTLFKKGLIVGIIVLFLGVSVIPSINAKINCIDNYINKTKKNEDEISTSGNIWAYHENWVLFVTTVICNKGNYTLYNVTWEWFFSSAGYGNSWQVLFYPIDSIKGTQKVLKPHDMIRIPTRVRGYGLFLAECYISTSGDDYYISSAVGIVFGSFIFGFIWPI